MVQHLLVSFALKDKRILKGNILPQGLNRFREVLSSIYSPLLGRIVDSNEEISVHSGGTEAILSTITAFVEPGDEVIVMEPAFDL